MKHVFISKEYALKCLISLHSLSSHCLWFSCSPEHFRQAWLWCLLDTDSITDLCSFRNSTFRLMRTPSTRSSTRWTSTKTDKWSWTSSYRYETLEAVIIAIYRLQVVLVSPWFSGRIGSCRCEILKNKSACYLHVCTSMFCQKPTGSQWLVALKCRTFIRMSMKLIWCL